jgi:hypothetical protein
MNFKNQYQPNIMFQVYYQVITYHNILRVWRSWNSTFFNEKVNDPKLVLKNKTISLDAIKL